MPPADQLCLNGQQLRHHPLLRRYTPHSECSIFPALPAIMREAQKRKGFRFPLTTLLPVLSGEPPKLDQSRLLGMSFEAELREPFPELFQESLRLHSAFEAHHQIIGVSDDCDIALRDFPAPDFDPQVEHIVQVDVRNQRRNHRPLRSSYTRLRPLALLRHPRLQPFLDEA